MITAEEYNKKVILTSEEDYIILNDVIHWGVINHVRKTTPSEIFYIDIFEHSSDFLHKSINDRLINCLTGEYQKKHNINLSIYNDYLGAENFPYCVVDLKDYDEYQVKKNTIGNTPKERFNYLVKHLIENEYQKENPSIEIYAKLNDIGVCKYELYEWVSATKDEFTLFGKTFFGKNCRKLQIKSDILGVIKEFKEMGYVIRITEESVRINVL